MPSENIKPDCVAKQNTLSGKTRPKVSVAMFTYNQEKYIAQAIESVLMQQTDFPVELILSEDCSTDGTRRIVEGYAERYPNVIRPLLQERNLGSMKNARTTIQAGHGEYIAILEGDDYWTDPHKLQKQVKLLEQNPHCSMCVSTAKDVYMTADGAEHEIGLYPKESNGSQYDLEYVLAEYPCRTLTYVMRNDLVQLPDWYEMAECGDVCILALFAEKGPIICLNNVTGTYRGHAGGIWTGSSAFGRCKTMRRTLDILNEHFSGRYFEILRRRDLHISKLCCLEQVHQGAAREAKRFIWESYSRFAPHMPFSYFMLGLSIYASVYSTAWHRMTVRMAIRTRIKKLLHA
jgi:glycosyltransferase involved in cell wall biosynthesis